MKHLTLVGCFRTPSLSLYRNLWRIWSSERVFQDTFKSNPLHHFFITHADTYVTYTSLYHIQIRTHRERDRNRERERERESERERERERERHTVRVRNTNFRYLCVGLYPRAQKFLHPANNHVLFCIRHPIFILLRTGQTLFCSNTSHMATGKKSIFFPPTDDTQTMFYCLFTLHYSSITPVRVGWVPDVHTHTSSRRSPDSNDYFKYLCSVQDFLWWVEFEYKDAWYSFSTQERAHSTHGLD